MDARTPPQDIPPEGPQPFLRLPWVVSLLVGVMLAIEALLKFVTPARASQIIVDYGFIPARYSAAFLASHHSDGGTLIEKALPFITYMFLHGGWAHVIINMVWLIAFGPVVMGRFGVPRFLLFFLVCGLAGAVTHLALNWGSAEPVIGASAAISGLMAAGFRMIGRDSVYGPLPLTPLFSRRILIWSAVWVMLNVIAGITGLGTAGGGVEIVAWQAHLGGFAAGLLLAGLFDPANRLNAQPL